MHSKILYEEITTLYKLLAEESGEQPAPVSSSAAAVVSSSASSTVPAVSTPASTPVSTELSIQTKVSELSTTGDNKQPQVSPGTSVFMKEQVK